MNAITPFVKTTRLRKNPLQVLSFILQLAIIAMMCIVAILTLLPAEHTIVSIVVTMSFISAFFALICAVITIILQINK